MKTEQEIRERIRALQLVIEEEEANGLSGGEEWLFVTIAKDELHWVLGVMAET